MRRSPEDRLALASTTRVRAGWSTAGVLGLACAALVLAVGGCVGETPTDAPTEAAPSISGHALNAEQCSFFAENGRITICHKLPRAKPDREYVVMRISEQACVKGHADHADDYVAYGDSDCAGVGCFPFGAPFDGTVPCCDEEGNLEARDGVCACEPGHVHADEADLFCSPCPPGSRELDGACVACEPNTYQPAPGQPECLPCNCDDDVCTDDTCDPIAGCGYAFNTAECDDGDACTTDDTCAAGACVGGAALACDDGDVCTDDGCDPDSGCTFTFNMAECDDGDACTTDDSCAEGACVGGPALACDDGDDCTNDSCDPASGCESVPAAADTACAVDSSGDACEAGGACDGGGACVCEEVTSFPPSGVVDAGAVALDGGNLLLGPSGVIVVYTEVTDGTEHAVKVARFVGGDWQIEGALADASARFNSAAVDDDGHLHIVYAIGQDLYYATDASGSWMTETIPGPPKTTSASIHNWSLALDDDGFAHVTSAIHVNAPGRYYTTNSSGAWAPATQISGQSSGQAAIAAAGMAAPGVVYAIRGWTGIHYAEGPNWGATRHTIFSSWSPDQQPRQALAVHNGEPVVAITLYSGYSTTSAGRLRVQQRVGGSWQSEDVFTYSPKVQGRISNMELTVDDAGHRYVAICERDTFELKIWSDVSGAWRPTSVGRCATRDLGLLFADGLLYLSYLTETTQQLALEVIDPTSL